jgi:uncharacterized protein (TIGR02145 family)
MMRSKFINKLRSSAKKCRNIIVIIFFLLAINSFNILYSMPRFKMKTGGPQDSVLVDKDGNQYPLKAFPDNNLWITSNLKLNVSGSYCYENLNKNCEQYGRLYTWESAQEGCKMLGTGWRLPNEKEWHQLRKYYGEFPNDSIQNRKKAYTVMLYGGSSEFNAVLGGARRISGEYARGQAHGFYWTATETDSSMAWFGNFAKGSQSLYMQKDGEKLMAISVRCVRKQ